MLIYPALEAALLCTDAADKCRQTAAVAAHCANTESLNLHAAAAALDFRHAGHPAKPELVPPAAVKTRKMTTAAGYGARLKAIGDIEFNGVILALDAAYRFRRLPEIFVRDWIRVAAEVSPHFG